MALNWSNRKVKLDPLPLNSTIEIKLRNSLMKIAIIFNAKRVTEDSLNLLNSHQLTEKYDIHYDLFIKEPQEIDSLLETLNLQTYNAVLVGGGDGTVRSVVKLLIGKPVPLVILPLGTFNLLAKSLEHPNDIDALFSIVKNNKSKQIDVAEVNGHIIINHLWIGLYSYLLQAREKYKNILGKNKILKILFNLFKLFKPFPIYLLELKVDKETIAYKTPLVLIGNNESYMDIFNFGEHKFLSSGLLSINILQCRTRLKLFLFMLKLLITSNAKNSKELISFSADNLLIKSPLKLTKTVIDGELIEIESPLKFILHAKKLMVLIP